MHIVHCSAVALVIALVFPTAANSSDKRPTRIDDQFALESLADGDPSNRCALQPGGTAVAFVVVRSLKETLIFDRHTRFGFDRSDIYLNLGPGKATENLTRGREDGAGFWLPQWSPDGRYLAMLSTRGNGGKVRLWVYNTKTRELRQASEHSLELPIGNNQLAYRWVDNCRLLGLAIPGDEIAPLFSYADESRTIAPLAWQIAREGRKATVSVLDSRSNVTGEFSVKPKKDTRSLLLVDIEARVERLSAELDLASLNDCDMRNVSSATGAFACCLLSPVDPAESRGEGTSEVRTSPKKFVAITGIDGVIPTTGDLAQNYGGSFLWSPDGRELLFFRKSDELFSGSQTFSLQRVDLASGRASPCEFRTKDGRSLVFLHDWQRCQWMADGKLAVRAAVQEANAPQGTQPRPRAPRADWYAIGKDSVAVCLTAGLKSPPVEIMPLGGRNELLGLADGDLWSFDVTTGNAVNLTVDFVPEIARLAWNSTCGIVPRYVDEKGLAGYDIRATEHVIFVTGKGPEQQMWIMDLATHHAIELAKPAPDAALAAFNPESRAAIFISEDKGLWVWRCDASSGRTEVLYEGNALLRDLARPEFKPIEYSSLDGKKLSGWILLPIGYDAGKKYPLLTWIYPSLIYQPSEAPSGSRSVGSNLGGYNMQVPAAQGYAILFPSMPVSLNGTPGDPMLEATNGVLPAVQKAVDLGIADANRIFVMGQSFGGFGTYSVITLTDRFKAAIAMSGNSDNISFYGSIDPTSRYAETAASGLFGVAWMSGKGGYSGGMGNPPWVDFGRYIRNSPIFYVDRVKTPLMAIYGDMDYATLQQGEEFFVSLLMQKKPAVMLRYWGEGHVFGSPANLRDMWSRIFAWFDDYGDIRRDAKGELVWDGDHVKSRDGTPALKPEDFLKLDRFFDQRFGTVEGGWPDYGKAEVSSEGPARKQ